jgi:hypothetical protein
LFDLRPKSIAAALAAAVLASTSVQAWETAHGPTDNTGFVNVATKPAETGVQFLNIGTIAPGAGPVVAPDGTVFLGNQQGKLMSFKPDGTAGWRRDITPGQSIVASPVIAANGNVFVIGTSISRDHRGGKNVLRTDAWLHVFNSTGGYFGSTPFPEHDGAGGTTASLNLWRFNGTELLIVPAVYGTDVRLLAFSTSGALVQDQHAITIATEIFGGPIYPWDFPASDGKTPRSEERPRPFPAVGIFHNPQGGTPFILLSDANHVLAGFTLSGGSFLEAFRTQDDNRFLRAAPAILPDKHAIIGTEDVTRDATTGPRGNGKGGAIFSGPNLNKLAPVTGLGAISATPTRLADGRVALIGQRQLVVLDGRNVVKKLPFDGFSFASAAASRTHLFVSTSDALYTFDPVSLTELAKMPWSAGGLSQPVISPTGFVYAVAADSLFVFPPALQLPPNRVTPVTGTTVVSTDPLTTQDSKAYKPPLAMSGNRLFACEKLDGDDCGKGDYQTIADAFCKKEGFIGAGQIKVDSKKGKAETLDGQYCSKKKCKVFEQIVCANN